MTGKAALELRDISFSYRVGDMDLPILSGINLRIEEGEMVAIQGPSGSGKSTLLYLMGALLRVQKGTLLLDNRDISQLSEEELALVRNEKLGYVFQQFHLLPKATVLKNILLPCQYSRVTGPASLFLRQKREKAEGLAKSFGLETRLSHRPQQLSGGQQQRVALARALINDAQIILADEPTGNLDSQSSQQVMEHFKELNRQGKTVILITHEASIAQQCSKIFHIRDGRIERVEEGTWQNSRPGTEPAAPSDVKLQPTSTPSPTAGTIVSRQSLRIGPLSRNLWSMALENLNRHLGRTLLTMLGIVIGIAAVLCMMTLGQFTKEKILESYADLGVNTLLFHGYPNWELKATDQVPVMYRLFDWNRDLLPLRRIFPQISGMSPMLFSWNNSASYAGKTIENEVRVLGVNEDALVASQRELTQGQNLNPFHLRQKSSVCLIGSEIAERLFARMNPLGQVLRISGKDRSYGCRVIGVLKSMTSKNEWMKPNLQVHLPFTYFQAVSGSWWESQIAEVLIQLRPGTDIERIGEGIKIYFEMKYGKSGRFRVNSDTILISQMKKFLQLFVVMLTSIALISLIIGGMGITNMMLVSVSERLREIGLRKAIGATSSSIRWQLLLESVIICTLAGAVGLLVGFAAYEFIIWLASKFVEKLAFTWVFDLGAILLSLISIVAVGLLSGLVPALKAEKMPVIEALRSE